MALSEQSPLLQGPERSKPNHEDEDLTSHEKGLGGSKMLGIFLALIGVFIAGADHYFVMATYVEIASAAKELRHAPWLLTGYNLGYCIALPVYGKLGDSLGRKVPLVWSYCIFGIGCLFCGLGFSFWFVVLGRVITGIGAAGMISLLSVMITDNVPPSQVAPLRSYISVVSVLGRSCGGPLGALISQSLGWKLSFLIQVPIIMICCLSSLILMPESQQPAKSKESARQSKDLDLLGLATFSLTMISFLMASSQATEVTETDSETQLDHFSVYVGLTVIFGLLFLLVETFVAKDPLLPTMGSVINAYMIIQVFLFIERATHMSNLVPYFAYVEGFTSSTTACYIIATPLGFTIGSIVGGQIIKRTRRSKFQSITALVASVLVYLLIAAQWAPGSYILEFLYIFLAGFTFALVLTATFVALAAAAPREIVATTITNYFLCQEIGSLLGTGLSTAMLHGIFRSLLSDTLEGYPNSDRIIKGVLNDINFSKGLPIELQEQIRMLFLTSFRYIIVFASAVTCLAIPLLIALPEEILE